MNIDWLKVYIAACFEVVWVIGLKNADHYWAWTGTIIAIIISFYLLIKAGSKLPVGTVYAVFVGLGTAGTTLSDIIFYGEPVQLTTLLFIFVLLIGVIGLKLVSTTKTQDGVDS